MEIFLLAVVIFMVAYLLNTLNSKFGQMEYHIRDLQRALENLKNPEVVEKIVEEPVVRTEMPVAKPPKEAVIDPIKPTHPTPGGIPGPVPVFAMDSASKPEFVKPVPTPYLPEKSWWETFKEKNPDLEKFIGENLINKIGVLILVLGISYFVKFAIDKNWINEPARAGIGILCGALVMGFAHKLRKNYAAFSSVLVAGAISIFYFTIGIAFHDYHLFDQTVAFIIMVVITGFSCLISLSYNRKELAVLSLIGGFAVPFMVSTGAGNYAVLFSYIIILDIGILALAYNRKWQIINILSYIFTVLLYGTWLMTREINEVHPHYLGALIFGFAFYFIFILINIINNLRTKGVFSTIELSILASNTFLFYAAGMVILSHYHPELKGLFTTVLALLNLVYAWFLYKKFGLDKTAVYLLIGLTLTFATLAIPIQFEGNYITLFWAAEAVLLIWLAQKSGIIAYRFGSVIVHVLMVISLMMDWNNIYSINSVLNIAINPIFITGAFAVLSLLAVHRLLKPESQNLVFLNLIFNPKKYRSYVGILALCLAYFTGMFEVFYQSHDYIDAPASAIALPLFYHLLFCAVGCHFLWKREKYAGLASGIAIANIILFALWFSNYPFIEHSEYISTGIYHRVAFYMHYASLLTGVYFAYKLYQYRERPAFAFLAKDISIWIGAFFIVYIASSELLLHGLVLSNSPATGSADYARGMESIHNVTSQIVKTGFPVLWGILAFIFLIVGIKKQSKPTRIIALALLGITILKLFLFDIRNASETGKIIAFILLGVLILIISFVYNKIKVLVLDDAKPTTINE